MSEENVEIIRELNEHWGRGDYAATGSFFDPKVEFARFGAAGVGAEGEWRGLEEMWAAHAEYLRAYQDVRNEVDEIIDLDDRVLVLARERARGRASGVPIEHEIGQLYTLRNGKVVRLEAYWDQSEALIAAGLSE